MNIGEFLQGGPLPMSKFDPDNAAVVARRAMEELTDPRRRQILQNFVDHATAECCGDYAALMASCSRKRQSYAVYGTDLDPTFMQPQSYAELEVHYRALIELNLYLIHFEVEKLTVGSDELWLEGFAHMLLQGFHARDLFGLQPDDANAVYMLSRRTVVCFVFDEDGLGCGEHAYSDGPNRMSHLSKIADNEVPRSFWNNPLTGTVVS